MNWPEFFQWTGPSGKGPWSLGWWGGSEHDLLSIRPCVRHNIQAELWLSPVSANRPLAVLAFLLKNMLTLIDQNMRGPRLPVVDPRFPFANLEPDDDADAE